MFFLKCWLIITYVITFCSDLPSIEDHNDKEDEDEEEINNAPAIQKNIETTAVLSESDDMLKTDVSPPKRKWLMVYTFIFFC